MPPKCRKKKKKHQQQKDIANPGHHYGIPTRETLSQRPRCVATFVSNVVET